MAEQGYHLEQTGPEVQGALNKIISISPATEEAPGLMSAEDKAKLDGITPANYATKDELASKVDKETGKGLSKNDYTDEDKALVGTIEGKQDTIQDLDGIRSGAALGATAYQKPATGIPATDLASAVQTSLGKADTALQQSDLEPIKEVIPDAATAQNKLADSAFVNSSIATATATFRGAYNLVTDLSLTTAATRAQIATALAGAVSTADNNDYAFVQVPTADVTPTEIARVERYKYNGSAWAFEYALNNSGFTASQWAALNSGITSGLVGKLSALPTNSELTTLLAGKQDTISDLSTIRTGAGLGATAYQKPASGIPASDMASGVIPDVSGKENTSNKVTSLSEQSTNEQYPGAKAVVDYVDEHGGGDDEAKEVAAAGLCDLDKRIKDILMQVLTRSDVRDNLTSAAIAKPLSANQGVVLKKINDDNEEVLAAALCSLYALSAIPAAIAPPYSGSKTYALNDCVTHKTLFWRCTTPVSSPEMFDPNKWTQSSLYEEMLRLLNA